MARQHAKDNVPTSRRLNEKARSLPHIYNL